MGLECKDFTPNYILIDESDAIIFADPLAFYKHVRSKKAHVCGFTAKEFVGDELATEKHMLDKMKFVSVDTTQASISKLLTTDKNI